MAFSPACLLNRLVWRCDKCSFVTFSCAVLRLVFIFLFICLFVCLSLVYSSLSPSCLVYRSAFLFLFPPSSGCYLLCLSRLSTCLFTLYYLSLFSSICPFPLINLSLLCLISFGCLLILFPLSLSLYSLSPVPLLVSLFLLAGVGSQHEPIIHPFTPNLEPHPLSRPFTPNLAWGTSSCGESLAYSPQKMR